MHPANPVPSFLSWITTGINPPSRPCTLHTALSSRPFPLPHRRCCTSGPTGVSMIWCSTTPHPLTPIRCCLRGPRSTGWCTRACRSTTRRNSRMLISGGWMGRLQGGRSGPAHKHGPANDGVRPGSPFLPAYPSSSSTRPTPLPLKFLLPCPQVGQCDGSCGGGAAVGSGLRRGGGETLSVGAGRLCVWERVEVRRREKVDYSLCTNPWCASPCSTPVERLKFPATRQC